VTDFLLLSVSKLKDFIHPRKFTGHQFRERQLAKPGASLNKTVYSKQTAQSIEEDCSDENPCLVWIAWSLRKSSLVLEEFTLPEMTDSFEMPQFSITNAGPDDQKCPSEYLQNATWVETLKSTVKGVRFGDVSDDVVVRAGYLLRAYWQRLDLHIDERVDSTKRHHYSSNIRDNLSNMAAAKCLTGHIANNLETFSVDECLLKHPKDNGEGDVFFLYRSHQKDLNLETWKGTIYLTTM